MRTSSGQARQQRILRYETGELIIKQGDYGISIYKILSGEAKIFRTYKGVEVPLANLGPGNIIGEMAFLNKDADVRSASARAIKDTELEVFHPRELVEKYAKTSAVLKIIIGQALNRLLRINRFMDHLAAVDQEEKARPKSRKDSWSSTREFYRKEVDIACRYRPAHGKKKTSAFLTGRIKDLSMSGMSLEVAPGSESAPGHDVGSSLHIDAVLPNGQELNVTAQIVYVKKGRGKVRLGMLFRELPDYYGPKKTLGFFLMPT